MMKIAIVFMRFPTQREAFASNEVKTLSQKGIEIETYSLRFKSSQINKLIEERNIEHISCSHFNLTTILLFIPLIFKRLREFLFLVHFVFKNHLIDFSELMKGLVLLPRYLQILDKLIEGNYDVIHLYWSHYPSIIGLAYKRFYPNRKLTMSLAAYDLRMKYIGSKLLINVADCVTTHSNFNVSKIDELNDQYKSIKIIYRGVPNYVGEKLVEKDKYKVVSVGALIKAKGFDDVLRAFEILKRKNSNYYLNIYGSGHYHSKLKELVIKLQLEDVSFKGHLSHSKLMDEIGSSSIFVFMSHVERLPNVVKEAIMNKCFCVVSRTEGIEELFAHKDESIVNIGDYEAAGQKICEYIDKPQKFERIIEDNYQHIKNNFSLNKTSDQYLQMWKSISQ